MAVKQVIVLRHDLHMRKGKMCAQAAHASMKVFFDRIDHADHHQLKDLTDPMLEWMEGLFTKVVVYVESEAALIELYNKAQTAKIPCGLIKDAGLTEFGGVPTLTALALGPEHSEVLDPITGELPLL